MVDRRHPSLSVASQCRLLGISRSGLYYQPKGISEEDLTLMKLIDRGYLTEVHLIEISMSRRGNPYDNATMESFFKTLKYEEVYLCEYKTLADVLSRPC